MNCANCGAAVPPNASRCLKCGSFVDPPASTPQPAQVPLSGEPAPPAQGPPVGEAVKSKLTAGLLGIFLGSLGIHRFYLGHVGIGVVQLLLTLVLSWVTCGITASAAWIWGLVEGIMILTGGIDRDAQNRPLKP